MMSKDKIKELLFDTVGFRSREEKGGFGDGQYGDNVLFCRTDDAARKPFSAGKQF